MGRGRLTRNKENAWLGGVCAGLADYYGQPVGVVRTLTIILVSVIPFLGWAYLGMWRSLPKYAEAEGQLTVNMGLARLRSCHQRLFAIEAEILQARSALHARIEQATSQARARPNG